MPNKTQIEQIDNMMNVVKGFVMIKAFKTYHVCTHSWLEVLDDPKEKLELRCELNV